jgi:hypothetical protein
MLDVIVRGVCWNSTRFNVGWAVATVTSIKIRKKLLQPAAEQTRPTYTVCGFLNNTFVLGLSSSSTFQTGGKKSTCTSNVEE